MWISTQYSMVNLDNIVSIDHTHDDDDESDERLPDAIVAAHAHKKDCDILFMGSPDECEQFKRELEMAIGRGNIVEMHDIRINPGTVPLSEVLKD